MIKFIESMFSFCKETVCPNKETLTCFIDGRLRGSKRIRISEHMIHCQKCAEKYLLLFRVRV